MSRKGKHGKHSAKAINSKVKNNNLDYSNRISENDLSYCNRTIEDGITEEKNYAEFANDIVQIVKESDTNDELVTLKRSYTKEELEKMIDVIQKDIEEERKKIKRTRKKGKRAKGKRTKEQEKNQNKYNDKENEVNEENEELRTTQNSRSKRKQKKKKKFTIKSFFMGIIELILLGIIGFSGYKIAIWAKDNYENNGIKDELESIVIETTNEENENQKGNLLLAQNYSINFYKLQQTNKDVVGWVKVNNTEIEYPIVKSNDNEYYLNHNLNNKINGAGWIFADYRNKFDGTDKNIVLYGHNRKDGSMFGTLKYAQTEQWYKNEDNKNIVFITPDGKYNYEVFSVYTIQTEDYYITTSFKTGEFEKFVNRLKSRSVYDFGVEVGEDDQILTFSTCSGENYRTVLHAKKIKEE